MSQRTDAPASRRPTARVDDLTNEPPVTPPGRCTSLELDAGIKSRPESVAAREFGVFLLQLSGNPRPGELSRPGIALMRLTEALSDLVVGEASTRSRTHRCRLQSIREAGFDIANEFLHSLYVESLNEVLKSGFSNPTDRNTLVQVHATAAKALTWEFDFRTPREERAAVNRLIEATRFWCLQLFTLIATIDSPHPAPQKPLKLSGKNPVGRKPKKAIPPEVKKRIIHCFTKGTKDAETVAGLVGAKDHRLTVEDVQRTINSYRKSLQPSRKKGCVRTKPR